MLLLLLPAVACSEPTTRPLPVHAVRYLNGKVPIDINGTTVWAQVGMNVTIPGSQSWKK